MNLSQLCIVSARDWNFESNSAYEGSNHDDGRAFDHSDVEDCAAAVQRMERRLPGINWQKLRYTSVHCIEYLHLIAWHPQFHIFVVSELNAEQVGEAEN
jgi:hypothetical protein